jgi:tight adherence protein B
MMLIILALSLFVAIVTAGSALAGWARTREEADRTMEQRLDLAAGASAKERDAAPVLKDQRLSTIQVFNNFLTRVPFTSGIERAIKQAGLRRRAGEILLYVPLLGCIGILAGLLVSGSFLISMMLGCLIVAIPLMMVYRRKRLRAVAFAEQLPDALDLIRAAIQAGHGFATALMVVASEFPDPIASEFREVSEETRLGLSLREALNNLHERIDDPDLPMLIIGVLIAEDSGGNLSEVLENIGHTIRERFKMSRDVRTMTAQGRLSGMVLTALPFIVGTATYFLNPGYFKPMLTNPLGHYMLAYAFISIVLGHFVVQRIARIQV